MKVIHTRNPNSALVMGLNLLDHCGISRPSRAGWCIQAPVPVTTVYDKPMERVVFWAERDANPFFHFFESLYFLAGHNDVAFPDRFVADYSQRFSDDGATLPASYGYRWKRHWGHDQIEKLVSLLKSHPDTRRAVLVMWDPACDLQEDESSRDVPCNTTVMFRTRLGGKDDDLNVLDMTVTCRSNDMIWGTYGANAVHFAFLLEYVAARLGRRPGRYYQISNDFHAYDAVYRRISKGALERPARILNLPPDPYEVGEVAPYPLAEDIAHWDQDLYGFFVDPTRFDYQNSFFSRVALPLWQAHSFYKQRDFPEALESARKCAATDWRKAAVEWLERRAPKSGDAGEA